MNEQEIFAAALEQEANRRAPYLDAACGTDAELRCRVENLLQFHDQAGKYFEKPAAEIVATVQSAEINERAGTVIGAYKLLEQIGEGGFGIVFMAEQNSPVRRKIALKIIKPGMDTRQVIARFEAERQALAMMDHPHIAKVFDAGTTDSGRPYFVMELVRGIPITDFCDQHQLTVAERLKLFVDVCQAAQHAHQKGIIHRDIKPSNVLVTVHDDQPVVKVIDFGVAKATSGHLTDKTLFTGFMQLLGTPLYMSPEQTALSGVDVDTRSDIYSLGVLLYELLTGTTPFDRQRFNQAALDEVRRIIREEEPRKPSTRLSTIGETLPTVCAHRKIEPRKLTQLLSGDLDWIVMKALEKDRTRRYETANGLSRDIQRYLADELVEARPPSASYRLHKLIRRNKAALTTAALLSLALLVGTVVSSWQAIRARKAEDLAELNRHEAEANQQKAEKAVEKYFTTVSESKLLNIPGLEPLRKELLQSALEYYQGLSAQQTGDPASQAELAAAELRVVTIMYWNGDREDSWLPHLKKGIEILERLAAEGRDTPELRRRVAGFLISNPDPQRVEVGGASDGDQVRDLLLRSIKLWEKFATDEPTVAGFQSDLASTYTFLATDSFNSDRPYDTQLFIRRAANFREKLVQEHPQEPRYRLDLARHHLFTARVTAPNTAQQPVKKGIELFGQLVAEYPRIPIYRTWLGISWESYGDFSRNPKEAVEAYSNALEEFNRLAIEFPTQSIHRYLATVSMKLGDLKAKKGEDADAATLFRRAAENFESINTSSSNHWLDRQALINANLNLSRAIADQPERQEAAICRAIGACESFYTIHDSTAGEAETHADAIRAYSELFRHLKEQRRRSDIEVVCRQVNEKYTKENPSSRTPELRLQQVRLLDSLAAALVRVGEYKLAADSYYKAVDDAENTFVEHPANLDALWQMIARLYGLADALRRGERIKESEEAESRAAMLWKRSFSLGEQDANRFNSRSWRIASAPTAEIGEARLAVDLAQRAVEFAPQSSGIWNTLGVAHYRHGNWQSAVDALEKGMDLSYGGTSVDWYFMAMANWQLGKRDTALIWYNSARLWTEQYLAQTDRVPAYSDSVANFRNEIARFRDEAAELMNQSTVDPKVTSDEVALCDAFITVNPRASTYLMRGNTFADSEQWTRADEDFAKSIELIGEKLSCWHMYARALLRCELADTAAYRAECARMLKQFASTDDINDGHFTAWACALRPDAIAEFAPAVVLANKAAKLDETSPFFVGGLGAIWYRAGHLEMARQNLEKADRLFVSSTEGRTSRAYAQFFLAMTNQRLGNLTEARQWLDKARQEMDRELMADAEGTCMAPWNRRLTLKLFCREAEMLVEHNTPLSISVIQNPRRLPVEARKP